MEWKLYVLQKDGLSIIVNSDNKHSCQFVPFVKPGKCYKK
jgi:hypothetical protein